MDTKILGSVWYTLLDGTVIGIVVINNGYEDKAYIGIGSGVHQGMDERLVYGKGVPFPLKQAKEMVGVL
jgi:hypothetical protein